jgi:hypothetical protein
MGDLQSNSKQFTDQQVSAILKRAVELQASRGAAPDIATGISLAQLQQAAAELGIDPAVIAEAASELESGSPPTCRSPIWGGPWAVDLERTVPGRVTEEEWPAVLQEIRRLTGRLGETTTVGKTFEWSSISPNLLHVTVSPRDDQTTIRVMGRFGDCAAIFVPAFAFALPVILGLTVTQHLPALTELGLAVGVLGGVFAAARGGFNALCRRKRQQAQDLLRAVDGLLTRAETVPRAVEPVAPERRSPDEPLLRQTLGPSG